MNTLNALVFAIDVLKKQVREFQEARGFTMNQAMLLRIKNDCEAFAESLGSVTRPSIPIQQLAKKFGFVINSLSSLAVKTSSGEVIGWWDLIGDFRLLSTPGWINSS